MPQKQSLFAPLPAAQLRFLYKEENNEFKRFANAFSHYYLIEHGTASKAKVTQCMLVKWKEVKHLSKKQRAAIVEYYLDTKQRHKIFNATVEKVVLFTPKHLPPKDEPAVEATPPVTPLTPTATIEGMFSLSLSLPHSNSI